MGEMEWAENTRGQKFNDIPLNKRFNLVKLVLSNDGCLLVSPLAIELCIDSMELQMMNVKP